MDSRDAAQEGFFYGLLLLSCCCLYASCIGVDNSVSGSLPLSRALLQYDVVKKDQLLHREVIDDQRSLVLHTLNKTFHLRLFPRQGLFEPGLTVTVVGAHGSSRQHPLDPSQFYSGELVGEAGSRVSAHLDSSGVLTASIYTHLEHYFIEPSYRHFPQSHDFHMISYRQSDIKGFLKSRQHCGTNDTSSTTPPTTPPASIPHTVLDSESRRQRRQTTRTQANSCPMMLVGSTSLHRAYSSNGGGIDSTVFFMVQVVDDVSQHIYRPVQWTAGLTNYGLTVKNVTVYESEAGSPAYNQETTTRDSSTLLRLFSHHDWSNFCLAHLFTFERFPDGRVGVAYPAPPNLANPGGICSPRLANFNGGVLATANVGLSSFKGDDGEVLLLGEARLITAHEIGHNWGSDHDPTQSVGPCNPPLAPDEGKFLMFPFQSDGTQRNNDQFSQCSMVAVAAALQARSSSCFTEEPAVVCGNYRVEVDEECDAGLPGMLNSDPCCTPQCKLREGKSCSDINHDCCMDCQVAPPTTVCRSFRPGNGQCLANVSCNGVLTVCPGRAFFEVNSTCREHGRCLPSGSVCTDSGDCRSSGVATLECYELCQLHNRQSCFCSGENECNVCCRDASSPNNSNLCVPFSPTTALPKGSSCIGGLCEDGRCRLTSPDLIERLYDLFADISLNNLIIFFSENIVGTVLVFSLLLWIPPSVAIHCCCDVRRLKKVREQLEYLEDEHQGNMEEDLMDINLVDQYPDKKAILTRGLSSLGIELEERPPYYSLISSSGASKRRSSRCSVRHGYMPRSPPFSRLQSQQSRVSTPDWDNFKYKPDS